MIARSLRSLLDPFEQALAADGYAMECLELQTGAVIRIVATPSACEDCLVPKDVMLQMIQAQLAEAGLPVAETDFVLKYPGDPE